MSAVIEPATAPAITTRFEFDVAFQSKLAALALRDTTFMQRTDGLMQPDYFTNTTEGQVYAITSRFYKHYKKAPGDVTTLVAALRKDVQDRLIRKEDLAPITDTVKILYGIDISDRDFAIDQVSTFAQHQALWHAVEESVVLIDRRDFAKVGELVRAALNVGANNDVGAYDYFEEIDHRTSERTDRAAGILPLRGISTGYGELDKHFYHKGWGRRELSVLMAGPKVGKTAHLIDFALAASLNCKNVLYITLEVAASIVANRMDANLSQQKAMELEKHIHDISEKIKRKGSTAGVLKIHEYPSGAMTCSDLNRLIERYKAGATKDGKPIIFDLIVLDYADLMAPERYTESATENSKSVYVGLRGIAMKEDVAMLTATQTNRTGAAAMVAKMGDVAEDFNKIRIADIIISINRSDEERALNQARLYFAACRNQRSGFTVRIEQDMERMRAITKILAEE